MSKMIANDSFTRLIYGSNTWNFYTLIFLKSVTVFEYPWKCCCLFSKWQSQGRYNLDAFVNLSSLANHLWISLKFLLFSNVTGQHSRQRRWLKNIPWGWLYCIGEPASDPPNPSSEVCVLIRGLVSKLLSNHKATTTPEEAWLFPSLLRLDVM